MQEVRDIKKFNLPKMRLLFSPLLSLFLGGGRGGGGSGEGNLMKYRVSLRFINTRKGGGGEEPAAEIYGIACCTSTQQKFCEKGLLLLLLTRHRSTLKMLPPFHSRIHIMDLKMSLPSEIYCTRVTPVYTGFVAEHVVYYFLLLLSRWNCSDFAVISSRFPWKKVAK